MAKISLRAYNREIEELIENGQTEEAIAHCKYILRQYPKHIDTYRSLGKAYLEAKRYSEAADILQRVLSVFPDDRVSQLGMSIIREDEGNLDAAIYHMERAFEVQPSNAAIQEELRRLYGRRDGVEPSKVRLTRGALVRMYERGQLYPQAIAEAKAALAEEPQRVDLMVVLAKLYHSAGQKVEASEICSRLLTRLPYCFEANRILAEILSTTSHSENAKIHQQRIQSLDPYIAFTTPELPVSSQVPDTAIMLEKLEWQPSQETGQVPEWTQTVGISLEPEEEKLPSWFDTVPQTAPKVETEMMQPAEEVPPAPEEPFTFAPEEEFHPLPEEQPQGEELPAWMSEAGWKISEGKESTEGTGGFAEEVEPVEPAELPDWVKSLAPQPPPESVTMEENPEELEALEKILPPITESTPPYKVSTPEEQPIPEEIGLPVDFTKPAAPETIFPQGKQPEEKLTEEIEQQPPAGELDMDAAMAWLESLAAKQGAEEETLLTPPEQRLEQPPEWVQQQIEDQASFTQPAEPQSQIPEAEFPSLEELPTKASELPPLPGEPSQRDMDEAFAWLESLAARQGAEEGLLTTPEERLETPPEWVTQAELEPPSQAEPVFSGEELISSEELPDWLKTLEIPEGEQPITAEPTQEAAEETLPAWLRSIADEESTPIQEPTIESSGWVEEAKITAEEEIEFPEALVELKQGETEKETLETQPEEEFELPDWLRGIEAAAVETTAEPTQPTPITQETPLKEELPEIKWAEEIGTEIETELPESELEEYLQGLEVQGQTEITEKTPVSTGTETPIFPETLPFKEVTPQPLSAVGEELSAEIPEVSPVASEAPPQEMAPAASVEMPMAIEQPPVIGETLPIPATIPPQPIENITQPEEGTQPETAESPKMTPHGAEAAVTPKESKTQTAEEKLLEAQSALAKGKLKSALEKYTELVESEVLLEETIHDIRDALYRYPLDIELWQTLGDAYLRSNRLQDALDAYTKAEELLR